MRFDENVKEARRQRGLSQEELAELLEVSRQAVSKWENGSAYPELDKLMRMCDIFHCTMDELLKQDMREQSGLRKETYEAHENLMSKAFSCCTMILLLGLSMELFLEAYVQEEIADIIFLLFVIVAVLGYIYFGMRISTFQRKYPQTPKDIYDQRELDAFDHRFTMAIVIGIGLLLGGLILQILLEYTVKEEIGNGVFMLMITAAVGIFVYIGMQKSKYSKTEPEPEKAQKSTKNEQADRWCGIIMLLCTIIFLLWSFVFHAWYISWLIFPIGGILCCIVILFLKNEKDE